MREYHITDNVAIFNDMPRGWITGKHRPYWHKKVYDMWRHTWERLYDNIYYFGSLIHPSFKYFSNYVKWIESQPRFEDFCSTCDTTSWSVDKDSKYLGNKNYYPEYMTLMLKSENTRERNNRNGNPNPKQSVLGVPLDYTNKIILTLSIKDVSNHEFHIGNVGSCIRKERKTHKGYKWYKVNYKHNKYLRIKR